MAAPRTTLVTGAASGIGKATCELLSARGDRVLGADVRDADIVADLASPEGRTALVDQALRITGGSLDGVVACAGVLRPAGLAVAVNYFGAVATLDGLRPLLAGSAAPRAVVVTSLASVSTQLNPDADEALIELIDSGDEPAARAHADEMASAGAAESMLYGCGKLALNRWVRRSAPSARWAGSAIALNAVAPGVVDTPFMAEFFATPEGIEGMERGAPAPLNGFLRPAVVGRLLAWLVSEDNTHLCGQVIFVDGGAEAIKRDRSW